MRQTTLAIAAIGIISCAGLALAEEAATTSKAPPDAAPSAARAATDAAKPEAAAAEGGSSTVGKAYAPATDPTVEKSADGKYLDKDGNPTFKIGADGTVDWFTYAGFRAYHSECHVCHGPYGEGSSYAPALKDSVKHMSYGEFLAIVANGRKNVSTASENVMPAFGHNLNVACHIDDLYIYLRARSDDALGRIRPGKREDKPEAAREAEASCRSQG